MRPLRSLKDSERRAEVGGMTPSTVLRRASTRAFPLVVLVLLATGLLQPPAAVAVSHTDLTAG